MAKTAAQIVPLKTQLSSSVAIFRFADATTDFAGNVAYQNFLYDNSGLINPANGTVGVAANTSGAVIPSVILSTPAAPILSTNPNAGFSITSGLNRYQTETYYIVSFYDSSLKESQAQVILASIPSGSVTGSVTFTFTWPPLAAGAVIYKPTNQYGFYAVTVPNTITTYIDALGTINGLAAATGVASFYYGGTINNHSVQPTPNSASLAPPVGPNNLTVTTQGSGGACKSSGYGYGLTAFNSLGETLVSPESTTVNPTGTPWITGASAGVMNNITPTASNLSGTLPVGKWYYQVTAYTQTPFGPGGINPAGFTNNNNYSNSSPGVGQTESLPSAEVNVTTTSVGNVTLTWAAVANAVGYDIYRSRDVPSPVQNAATTSTTGGTLPATTTYYYVVTATNANGETLASNEVTITTGATATNSVVLSWANVLGAYGYKVYRGTAAAGENALLTTIALGSTITFTDTGAATTAVSPPGANTATGAGQETYLTQVPGASIVSYQDSGASSTSQNSGFQPPKVYNGIYSAFSVSASWTAVTGATGYNLYRGASSTIANASNYNYFNVPSGLTQTDAGNQTGAKYTPKVNWTASPQITTVGRYINTPSGASYCDRLGVTVALAVGQSYRFMIYNQSTQTTTYIGSYFSATSSSVLYYEVNPNVTITANTANFFYLEGQTLASTISWGANPKPTVLDNATINITGEYNTWAGQFTASAYSYLYGSSQQLGQAGQDGQYPTQVLNETLSSLPMRVNFRMPFSGTAINGVKGTFLGGPRLPQVGYSPNATYPTPVKAITPAWNVSSPLNSLNNPFIFAGRWVTVEVSADGGLTFVTLTNQVRYVPPTPATQLQFRYTVPQNSVSMSFDRRLMSNLPATDNTSINNTNYYFTPDTNNATGYFYQQQSNTADLLFISNGNLLLGNAYNNFQYDFFSIQGFSIDVDMTAQVSFNQTGNVGLRFRNDGSASSYGGYYAYIDNAGNWGINRTGYANTSTTLVSGAGVTNGLLNQSHILRVIVIGSHIQFFVDGFKVGDVTDATAGNYQTGTNVGLSGARGIVQGFQATALTAAQVNNSLQWELEYVAAFLET